MEETLTNQYPNKPKVTFAKGNNKIGKGGVGELINRLIKQNKN